MPGGMRCAVAICQNNCKINPNNPDKQIMFHRFPKDKKLHEVWVQKCGRQDKINVKYARVCSEHFTGDDYIRNLQAELLDLPRAKRLKPTAVPTVKLFDEQQTPEQCHRRKRLEAKKRRMFVEEILAETIRREEEQEQEASAIKETQFQVVQSWSAPTSEINSMIKQEPEDSVTIEETKLLPLYSPPRTATVCTIRKETCGLTYDELLRKYDAVVREKEEINRHLQLSAQWLNQSKMKIEDLEKEVSNLTSKFKQEDVYRSQLEKALRRLFSKGQLDFVIGRKKKIVWSPDDIKKAFTLRNFSKSAYIYLKDSLQYPLPGISSLQRWASKFELKQDFLASGLESNFDNYECNSSEDVADWQEVISLKEETNSDEF